MYEIVINNKINNQSKMKISVVLYKTRQEIDVGVFTGSFQVNGGTWFAHETSPCQLASASLSSDGSVRGKLISCISATFKIEHSGSGVELWTLDYENPGSNPVLRC